MSPETKAVQDLSAQSRACSPTTQGGFGFRSFFLPLLGPCCGEKRSRPVPCRVKSSNYTVLYPSPVLDPSLPLSLHSICDARSGDAPVFGLAAVPVVLGTGIGTGTGIVVGTVPSIAVCRYRLQHSTVQYLR
jgi:hypothetical protein